MNRKRAKIIMPIVPSPARTPMTNGATLILEAAPAVSASVVGVEGSEVDVVDADVVDAVCCVLEGGRTVREAEGVPVPVEEATGAVESSPSVNCVTLT